MRAKKLIHSLYFQVIIAIILGVLLGHFHPELGEKMKPLGDGFIKLIKMIIAPVIFCTVVVGIAGMEDLKKVGRVGGKALIYFEVVTTIALVLGLVAVNLIKPGEGIHASVASLDTKALDSYTKAASSQSITDFILNIIPSTLVDAFAKGEMLQVLFLSVMVGFALSLSGAPAKPITRAIETVSHLFFKIVEMIMRVAPIGAFGAMAFTISKYGIGTLASLGQLMAAFYLTCFLFIAVILGTVSKCCGISIWKFLYYIRDELLIVLGTSSSESALPRLMRKMEKLGCAKSVVGLVIPTGYSFNLDGTCIYFTMAAIFIAQATDTPLTLTQELTVLGVLLLTSKGAAGVTGSGFITLAATLTTIGTIPVAGLALILGIDRFMSEARAITNIIGNGIATIVIAKWEKELDYAQMERALSGETDDSEEEAPVPVAVTI
jgi:aerobic C4-dicarboxylate transport protein